jgi:HK97 family phage major capsid protein
MDPKEIQKAVQDGIAAGIEPLKRDLEAANKRTAELEKKVADAEKAPATDNVRSLVGLVPSYVGVRGREAEERRDSARRKMRTIGYDEHLEGAPQHVRSGMKIARWLHGVALTVRTQKEAGQGTGARVMTLPEVFKELIGDARMADIADVHMRTMQASSLDSGGAFIPDVLAADWIEFLRPLNVVLSFNPTILGLDKGNLKIVKQTSGVSTSWEGENVAPAPVAPDTGLISLDARSMKALVVISQKLIKRGGPAVEQMIMRDLAAAISGQFDLTAIRGTGFSNAPSGLKSLMDAGQKVTATNSTTPTGAQVESDLYSMFGKVQDADNLLGGEGTIMAPRVERYLKQLRTTNGVEYFPEMQDGMLRGYPYKATTNIPKNLGGGTNESEIYFGSFPELLVGMEESARIEVIPNGALSVSGTVYSDAGTDTDVIKAGQDVDFKLRHGTAFAMLQTVKWGG